MSRLEFWNSILLQLRSGNDVFLAIVVDNTIHSPGSTGAKMAVYASGERVGTIGGGIMEQSVIERACAILRRQKSFPPECHRLVHRREGPGEKSGLICSGAQTNVYLVLSAEHDSETVDGVVEKLDKDEQAEVSVSSSGITLHTSVSPTAPEQARYVEDDGGWAYTEFLSPLKRVAIFGGGHCGFALSRLLSVLGYHITIFDDRQNLSTMEANSYADRKLTVESMDLAAAHITNKNITAAIVMGTDIHRDIASLAGILQYDFDFVGLMGSPAKINEIKKALRSDGVGDDKISSITAPVGIDIHSKTPEEIAVSIAAQLIGRHGHVHA